ncbi:MAG: hypothetical protein Q9P44_16460 [Anaerolineae bacterium]|nr:hypothetical protein [Anaerolineae bacterium]
MKRLTMKDQITVREHRQRMLSLSDDEVKKFGYPNAKVLRLSYRLSEIVGKWRGVKTDALVHEYKSVLYEMILNGYDVNTLPIQDQLPEDLMPELPPEPVQAAIQRVYHAE